MPLSVIELIARELLLRLRTLVNNSTYETNVVEVIRPRRLGEWTPKDFQIVMTQGASDQIEDWMLPGSPPAIGMSQVFNIRCHVMTDEHSLDTIDETINQFASDVITAVCVPVGRWHNFDGNAIDAAWREREMISADGGLDGVNLHLEIMYRVTENDPTEAR